AAECSVQRRRLAAARWTGDEQDAVLSFHEATKRLERSRRHAKLLESDTPATMIEQPEHDTLSVHGGNGGHAQVQLALLQPHANASILRPTPLRDVELREELDS